MKKRTKKIHIHLSNRWLYTLIALGIILIVAVGVYAATYTASGGGHPRTEISICEPNKILKMNAVGTAWECLEDATSGISTNPLYIEGAITAPEGTLRDDGGGWIRTYGQTGWYSQSYGGGWFMQDSTWIRAYNNKPVYIQNGLRADAGIASGNVALPGAGNIQATGSVTATSFSGSGAGLTNLPETDPSAVKSCLWRDSGWLSASTRVAKFSVSCNKGSWYAVSCSSEVYNPDDASYNDDVIISTRLYTSGSTGGCEIVARDVGGLAFEHSRKIKVLCCYNIPAP